MLQALRRPADLGLHWLWPAIIVVSAVAAGGLVYAGVAGPLRVAAVLWFLLICPGMAFVRLLRVADLATELMLAIGLSLALDAVVAIGYGTVKQKDLTTAVSVVKTDDLARRPITSASGALQGKAAGVQVIQPNGSPGQGMVVRVRGASSISSSNDPLYVVDGVPVGEGNYAIAYLSPNEIESMQVLKDASSAAICTS